MGKKRGNNSSGGTHGGGEENSSSTRRNNRILPNLYSYVVTILCHPEERSEFLWLVAYVLMGVCFGMAFGSGYLLGGYGKTPWRLKFAQRIRNSVDFFLGSDSSNRVSSANTEEVYQQILQLAAANSALGGDISELQQEILAKKYGIQGSTATADLTKADTLGTWQSVGDRGKQNKKYGTKTSSLPIVHRTYSQAYYTLRETIIREDYGYVHSDLGILSPAPCGADRGLGMVSSRFHECQVTCSPGTSALLSNTKHNNTNRSNNSNKQSSNSTLNNDVTAYHLPKGWYPQEEILLRIPLSIQMTRATALAALQAVVPEDVQSRAPLEDLDDAFLLALQLAHEHGRGRESKWHPYIANFPSGSQCGYAPNIRASAMDMISSLGGTYGLDVNGWPAELQKSYNYAEQISSTLSQNYGSYISVANGVNVLSLLQWALCHVSSRAIGGSELDANGIPIAGSKKKSLRLVPLLDMINHDVTAGMAQELISTTTDENSSANDNLILEDGKTYDVVQENERGAFIVRNMRHGKVIPLTKGQELLINYNVPEYSALDWFLLMSFVPPERMKRWVKVESALPRVRVQRPSSEKATSGKDSRSHDETAQQQCENHRQNF